MRRPREITGRHPRESGGPFILIKLGFPPSRERLPPILWALTALFTLRVLGQLLVAVLGVPWLPPMERWYSGLIPYPLLLASQIAILVLMLTICIQFTRRRGWFAVMIGRAVFVGDRPIPIVFHWVLAAFVLSVASWHRR